MQDFFHFNFNQEKFTTGLKQASADQTENVYLSFAALLSWNGQLGMPELGGGGRGPTLAP